MLKAMIKKEFLLVFRDKHALLALFIMPAIFILIMSVAMKNQFSTNDLKFTVFITSFDKSETSENIISNIQKDKRLIISSSKDKASFNIEIPEDYEDDNKLIKIYINGTIKSDQLSAFKSVLSEHILSSKFGYIANELEDDSPEIASIISSVSLSDSSLYKVIYNNSQKIPNSTQQSVPAWIVFGMFFIIIPMSTIYINERKQNTLARLNSMNISVFSMMVSKSIPYLIINQFQVIIMIAVGMFIVPFFNTAGLEINGSIIALFGISLALSISAIGVSTLIAVSASSSEQATTIGGILNILLGAIGGVMVPKFIMPEAMQNIAELSPMSWGLDGFLNIFLNSANLIMISNKIFMLIIFGFIALFLSAYILKKRINKGF